MPVMEEEQALSPVFQVWNFGEKVASFQAISGLTKLKVMQFEVCIKNEGVGGAEEEYGKEEERSYSYVKLFALTVGAKSSN